VIHADTKHSYSFYAQNEREISQFFAMDISTIKNQLDKFESGGVWAGTTKGRTRLYSFNPRYPFLKELKLLLDKALSFYLEDKRENSSWKGGDHHVEVNQYEKQIE
jgi:hypothetical protein